MSSDFYRSSHPTSADVFLLVEVADTSLVYDTQIKLPLYARHAIPEVMPLIQNVVDIHLGIKRFVYIMDCFIHYVSEHEPSLSL
jgi:hypothetical protein